MRETSKEAGQLGRRLRRDLPRGDEAPSYAAQRSRLVQASAPRSLRRVAGYGVASLAAAVAVAAVALSLARSPATTAQPLALTFAVGAHAKPGRVGEYYVAPGEAELPLSFSDGSRVMIRERAGLRVSQAAPDKTVVLVEGGAARFEIVPKSSMHWEVAAGPYVVRVTGTSFELTWTATTQTLELQMQAGVVHVFGPGIEGGYRVRDRERFVTHVTAALLPAASAALTPPIETDAQEAEPHEARVAPAAGAASVPARDPRAEYRRLVDGARQRGLSSVLASAPAAELRALSDAARFTGQPDVARQALLALRERFAGTWHAASAAFLLGRLAGDAGDARGAIAWYDRHMREGGELLPEALGRKMLAQHHAGDGAAAKRTADDYLERFPQGPYARQARDLAGR
jgi:hypothetical protein